MQIQVIKDVSDLLGAHPLVYGYIASAFVQSLPVPGTAEPVRKMIYHYFYDVTHVLVNAMPGKYKPAAAVVAAVAPQGETK